MSIAAKIKLETPKQDWQILDTTYRRLLLLLAVRATENAVEAMDRAEAQSARVLERGLIRLARRGAEYVLVAEYFVLPRRVRPAREGGKCECGD
jgi:hypothetical protein